MTPDKASTPEMQIMAARFTPHTLRRTSPLLALMIALTAAGCQTPNVSDITSTVGMREPPPPTDEGALRAYTASMEPRYASDPDNKAIAMNYAQALRGLTQHAQAVAVLQRLAVKYPQDMSVLAAYGKALADAGRLQEAQTVLGNSHTPEHPNWSVLSAQGSVADQLGDHSQARAYYASALKIVPHQPQVLSNMGLSYALDHRMAEAEASLRDAAAQPGADRRVRENLAMILSLEKKYAEAEDVSRRDLSPIDAAENIAELKRSARADTWIGKSVTATNAVAPSRAPTHMRTASSDEPR